MLSILLRIYMHPFLLILVGLLLLFACMISHLTDAGKKSQGGWWEYGNIAQDCTARKLWSQQPRKRAPGNASPNLILCCLLNFTGRQIVWKWGFLIKGEWITECLISVSLSLPSANLWVCTAGSMSQCQPSMGPGSQIPLLGNTQWVREHLEVFRSV